MFSEKSIKGFITPNLNGTNLFSKDNKGFFETIRSYVFKDDNKGLKNIKKIDLSDIADTNKNIEDERRELPSTALQGQNVEENVEENEQENENLFDVSGRGDFSFIMTPKIDYHIEPLPLTTNPVSYELSSFKSFDVNNKIKQDLIKEYRNEIDNNLSENELNELFKKNSVYSVNTPEYKEQIKENINEKKQQNKEMKIKEEMKIKAELVLRQAEEDKKKAEEALKKANEDKLIKEREEFEKNIINIKQKIFNKYTLFYGDKEELKTKIDNTVKYVIEDNKEVGDKNVEKQFVEEYYEKDLNKEIENKKNNLISRYVNVKKYNISSDLTVRRSAVVKDMEKVYKQVLETTNSKFKIATTDVLKNAFADFYENK